MKNKILIALLLISTMILSTPHYPNGIPNIGPLEGENTFWGEDLDGAYYDGVTYGVYYNVDIPNNYKLRMRVSLTTYSGGETPEKNVTFNFDKPVEGFTGEINIKYKNKKGDNIVRNYKGNPDKTLFYTYDTFFDFTDAGENAKVTMELLLANDKKITVKLKDAIARDLITISQLF